MRLSPSIACTGFVVVLSVPAIALGAAQAQAPSAAPGNSISQAIKDVWTGAKRNLTESADQMPEADYAFKPTEQVRTFGQILAHVAGANYVFCSAGRGEAKLEEYCWPDTMRSFPAEYTKTPLLRDKEK